MTAVVVPFPLANRLAFISQRDDGKWSIGFDDDAPGPFESRQFAESVASQSGGASS
jgi:hypothetical protein